MLVEKYEGHLCSRAVGTRWKTTFRPYAGRRYNEMTTFYQHFVPIGTIKRLKNVF
ncbi:MAG: hypothetical protein LBR51_01520 [Bacteroidales bacterium]|nr:hypothetical protein [Bacteroidales bacterium]